MSDDLASALLPYTSHSIGCAIYQRSWATGEPPCTCGLDEVRARLSATPSQRLDAATVERCAQVADTLFNQCTHSDTEAFAYEAAAKAIRNLIGAA